MAFPMGHDGEPSIFLRIQQDYRRRQRARLVHEMPLPAWDAEHSPFTTLLCRPTDRLHREA